MKELPGIAAGVRDAAKRILARDGFGGVTINSVAEEACEYRTAAVCYFCRKQGLLEAVADSITPCEACVEAVARCDALPAGPERVAAHFSVLREMAEDQESFRAFFELFPHLLREEGPRQHFADLNEWCRALDARMLGITPRDPEELRYVASTLIAAVDGLAFQACLDPDRVDLKEAFAASEHAVTALLPTVAVDEPVEPVDADLPTEAATSGPGPASSRRPWPSQNSQA